VKLGGTAEVMTFVPIIGQGSFFMPFVQTRKILFWRKKE